MRDGVAECLGHVVLGVSTTRISADRQALARPAAESEETSLDHNDGCAVTRSPEAKDLGIGIGESWFKIAPRAKERGLIARSSNYELYGDISARVMELLGRYSAWLEVYILYPGSCCWGDFSHRCQIDECGFDVLLKLSRGPTVG
jgi:hypothetical protein